MKDETLLKRFNEMVERVSTTPGTNQKIEVIREYEDIKDLIKRVWEPNAVTNVTRKTLEKRERDASGQADDSIKDITLLQLFDNLVDRKLTGHAAHAACWQFINRYKEYRDLLLGIFEKETRIRLGVKNILKAFPNLYEIFAVTLAEKYTETLFRKQFERARNKAWISRKIDGVRLICIIKKDTIQFYSRAGNEWKLPFLDADLRDKFIPYLERKELDTGVVLDGELIAFDVQGRENFKKTTGEVRRKNAVMNDAKYFVFDFLTVPEFYGSVISPGYGKRLNALLSFEPSAKFAVLQQTPYSDKAFNRLVHQASDEKWEGVMIRFDQPYKSGRTPHLLKYKFIEDNEYRVESVTIKDMKFPCEGGKEETIRALNNVIILHKKCKVAVGSGFSKDERVEYGKHPNKIMGKTITVEYQEEFFDKDANTWSLRCPIFKGIVGDETREV